jgi:hypothetical protein
MTIHRIKYILERACSLRKSGGYEGAGKCSHMLTVMAGGRYIVLGYRKHSREGCRMLRRHGAGTRFGYAVDTFGGARNLNEWAANLKPDRASRNTKSGVEKL